MIDPDRLTRVAFDAERVASRKLAARSAISELEALHAVLSAKAGTRGLDALLREREQRSARRDEKKADHVRRQALRQPDPTRWNAWFDGSARPNPGPCAIGALLLGPAGERVEISRHAGHGSSSEAEYWALLAVLDAAHQHGVKSLAVYGDSRVVIDDIGATPSAASLLPLKDQAIRLAIAIGQVEFHWIPRHRNERADQLAQQGHRD
jgi:ribonuclease HI